MNVYVGNFATEATEEDLRGVFEDFGEITEVKIIKDPASGQSKGFGFVRMSQGPDAQKAIAALNGKEWKGLALIVNPARTGRERRSRDRRGSSSGHKPSWKGKDHRRGSRRRNNRRENFLHIGRTRAEDDKLS